MYTHFKALNTDIILYNIYFILFYIMYYIHIVKRFRAHCGFYAIENKLLLLLLLSKRGVSISTQRVDMHATLQTRYMARSTSNISDPPPFS